MNEEEFIGEYMQKGAKAEPKVAEEQEAPRFNETEQAAYDQGWRPEEEFEGKEGNWKTAKEYVKDGEFISKITELNRKIDAQKNEFDERLENTNKLNEARRKAEIEELKARRREAVNNADEEEYDKAQAKIDKLEEVADVTPSTPRKDPAIIEWENKNAWINDPSDERTAIAQGIWNNYSSQNPNATAAEALAHVDSRINKLYPASNPRREQPDANETPTRKPRQKGRELSMSDLTQDEQAEWDKYGSMMFKDQKAFLKAVTDTRKKA